MHSRWKGTAGQVVLQIKVGGGPGMGGQSRLLLYEKS